MATTKKNDGIKKQKGDYGIRVARPGYDARYCNNNQLLFNSAWPIMQIAKVIDFNSQCKEICTYTRLENDGSAYTTYDRPTGLMFHSTETVEKGIFKVGKQYCYKLVEINYGIDNHDQRWVMDRFKVKSHQLGFVPFWFNSAWVSDINDKIILTSIDAQTDIDYPYDETAARLVGSIKDYGITSSSVFGGNVKGLDTGMFSKLVKRVMTTQKSGYTTRDETTGMVDKHLIWYPVAKPSQLSREKAEKYMAEYECYCLSASPYITSYDYSYNAAAFTVELSFSYNPVRVEMNTYASGGYPVGFSTRGQTMDEYEKALIIVRSPLVSPEYEEASI